MASSRQTLAVVSLKLALFKKYPYSRTLRDLQTSSCAYTMKLAIHYSYWPYSFK